MKRQKRAKNERLGNDANIVAKKPKDKFRAFKELAFAQKLLIDSEITNRKGKPHRTRFCHAVRAYQAEQITVRISGKAENGGAALAGVQTCGSVWACTVCAGRIAAQRGKEISRAIDLMIEDGCIPIMLSNTAWHTKEMPLSWLKEKFKQAHRYFVQSRRWRELKAIFGIKHSIKAVEVTYGFEHGWHPHQHAILFAHADAINSASHETLETWISDCQDLWLQALEHVGLWGLKEIALDVKVSADVKKDYIAKLGLSDDETANLDYELSGGMNKEQGGRKIWSLLHSAWQGHKEFEQLYIEYVEAMTGDNWITWSHGLKALCKIEEMADEEAANIFADLENDSLELMAISDDEFLPVRKLHAIGDLLELAATSRDENTVREFLQSLAVDWNNSGKGKERDKLLAQLQAMRQRWDNWRKQINKSQNFPADGSEFYQLYKAIEELETRVNR
jgi:hypothetical protein